MDRPDQVLLQQHRRDAVLSVVQESGIGDTCRVAGTCLLASICCSQGISSVRRTPRTAHHTAHEHSSR